MVMLYLLAFVICDLFCWLLLVLFVLISFSFLFICGWCLFVLCFGLRLVLWVAWFVVMLLLGDCWLFVYLILLVLVVILMLALALLLLFGCVLICD